MRQRGIPISEKIALRSGETDVRNMTYRDGNGSAGGEDLSLTSGQARLGPIALCRNRSQSAWLHFPHLELLFLFFAFEGVVAAAAELLEHSGCPQAFYPALILLVSSVHRLNVTHDTDCLTYYSSVAAIDEYVHEWPRNKTTAGARVRVIRTSL